MNSLRARLLSIIGSAVLALLVMLTGSWLIGAQQSRDLRDVEERVVPKLELEPKLENEFEHLRDALHQAVAAHDSEVLEGTLEQRNRLFQTITDAKGVIEPSDAAALRWKLQDYHQAAQELSRRLIAGEAANTLHDLSTRVQAQEQNVNDSIKRTTGLSRVTLAASFATVQKANERAFHFRLAIGLLGLSLLLALSFSASRSVLHALADFSRGLSRFATSEFGQPIPSDGLDEFAKLAREANQMAANLKRLAEQREADGWLKEGQARLSEELLGAVEPKILADRIVRVIAARTSAVAGALYLSEADGLSLFGSYARETEADVTAADARAARKRLAGEARTASVAAKSGEGLLREAARSRELTVIEDVPRGYLNVRTGLGESSPLAIVLLPLASSDETVGVLELALFKPCSPELRQFLQSIREMLVGSLQAARSRRALRQALEHTQSQAERLVAQEEELLTRNQELFTQHEELRAANRELEAQREELSERNAQLEEARRRLQQKAEELGKMSSYKSQFLANMSHELRTPLNSMLLLSHLLAENEAHTLSPKQVEYARTIHTSGTALLNLINQVLDLAKIEAGRQDLALEQTPLSRFTDYARRVFEPMAAAKKLELNVSLGDGLPSTIHTDPARVERIVTNLLGNAIKFTDRGRIGFSIARVSANTKFVRSGLRAEDCLALSVSDTGIGISVQDRERVFAPFEQIDSDRTRRHAGTGLGLAISRESAALLGGELELVSEPGQGSTFTCFLPLLSAPSTFAEMPPASVVDDRTSAREAERPRRRSRIPSDESGLDATLTGLKLLLAEDDMRTAYALSDVLSRQGALLLFADSGNEALDILQENPDLDLVLMDLTMPGVDGFQAIEKLRADPRFARLPVVALTAKSTNGERERCLEAGASECLSKPFDAEKLLETLRALMKREQGEQDRRLA